MEGTLKPQQIAQLGRMNGYSWALAGVGLAGAVLLVVLAANLIAGWSFADSYRVDLGTRTDRSLVDGLHAPEQDAAGTTYRWSNGDARLSLNGSAIVGPAILTLELGWLPPGAENPRIVALGLDDADWASIAVPDQPRRYRLLLPPGSIADGAVPLGLRSGYSFVGSDNRPLGLRVDSFGLEWPGERWLLPAAAVLAAQVGLALLWLGLGRWIGLGLRSLLPVAALLVAGMALNAAIEPHLAGSYQLELLGFGLASAATLMIGSTALRRAVPDAPSWFLRSLLLITLAALAIRFIGALYPSFVSHDLWVNGRRLYNVQIGTLTLFDRPSEFSRRIVTVSPTAYLLAAPLGLVGDGGLSLHGIYSLLDGTSALLVALLARRLGLSWGAALVAGALIAALPMQMTALYWGFVKQIVGQWLTLLLLVIVAGSPPRDRLNWLAIGALCTLNLLIHPGGLLLCGACLGLYLLFGGGQALRAQLSGGADLAAALRGPELAIWRGWLFCFGGSALAALALQYADAAVLVVGGMITGATESPLGTNQQSDQEARLWQIWVGLRASFAPLTLLLVMPGLYLLLLRARGNAGLLVACWLATGLIFLLVDILTGQQVRYGYFVAPLACAGVALLAEPLLRLPLGRAAVIALIALVVVSGSNTWLAGALEGVRMSVNPLTH